ncbi:MAG: protein-L-isoaspartate(D-aspartate) O-methyltransferase [Planctomycetes bacterium]|nr:protein-L-isoaspartate(D-aspartate) O-methyltransferase [Planctomycetota bacterium]
MTVEGRNPIRRRRRGQVLVFWLVVAALSVGGFLGLFGGLACRGRDGRPAPEQPRGAVEPNRERREPEARRRDHPAFDERVQERGRMVAHQIAAREIRDPNVLEALRTVPRHVFMPAGLRAHAYEDGPLPIGHGQTISQPYIVAFMTEALQLDPNSVVLEIGTGSGYQAAVCAEIAKEVYTIEIVEPLARSAAELLTRLGYENAHVQAGDGYFGWPEKGPFDAIIGTAAAGEIPPPLLEQLKPGGRMILPVGGQFGLQHLILLTKDEQGQFHRQNVLPVRFVPMTGRVQQPREGSDK